MAGWLARWLAGWLARWLAGWLARWLAGWLGGWLGGWFSFVLRPRSEQAVIALPSKSRRKDVNILFNDAINTFMIIWRRIQVRKERRVRRLNIYFSIDIEEQLLLLLFIHILVLVFS